jgi:hypothetical protein
MNIKEEYYKNLVSQLRTTSNEKIKTDIRNETNMKYKCILSKYHLSSQQWSTLLEEEFKKYYKWYKKKDEISGDAVTKKLNNVEIKISLGSNDNKFNFVQIRPNHNIDYYLFVIYDLNKDEMTKYIIDKSEIINLILKKGEYSHGTIKRQGRITLDNIINNKYEYSLRFNCNNYEEFLSPYKKEDEYIRNL